MRVPLVLVGDVRVRMAHRLVTVRVAVHRTG
jgi:hypothetical protein